MNSGSRDCLGRGLAVEPGGCANKRRWSRVVKEYRGGWRMKCGKSGGQDEVQRGIRRGEGLGVSGQLSAVHLVILDAWHGMQRAEGRYLCLDSRGRRPV